MCVIQITNTLKKQLIFPNMRPYVCLLEQETIWGHIVQFSLNIVKTN